MSATTQSPKKTNCWPLVAAGLALLVFLPTIALFSNKMSSASIPPSEKIICGGVALASLASICFAIAYAVSKIKACGIGLSLALISMAIFLVSIAFPHLVRTHTGDYMQGVGDAIDVVMIVIAFSSLYCVYALGDV